MLGGAAAEIVIGRGFVVVVAVVVVVFVFGGVGPFLGVGGTRHVKQEASGRCWRSVAHGSFFRLHRLVAALGNAQRELDSLGCLVPKKHRNELPSIPWKRKSRTRFGSDSPENLLFFSRLMVRFLACLSFHLSF